MAIELVGFSDCQNPQDQSRKSLYVDVSRYLERVIEFEPKVPNGVFYFLVSKQELAGA